MDGWVQTDSKGNYAPRPLHPQPGLREEKEEGKGMVVMGKGILALPWES